MWITRGASESPVAWGLLDAEITGALRRAFDRSTGSAVGEDLTGATGERACGGYGVKILSDMCGEYAGSACGGEEEGPDCAAGPVLSETTKVHELNPVLHWTPTPDLSEDHPSHLCSRLSIKL